VIVSASDAVSVAINRQYASAANKGLHKIHNTMKY
jgi:hypothetical protein